MGLTDLLEHLSQSVSLMHDPPGHCRVKDSLEHLSPSDSLMYNPPGHCRVIRFTGMFYLCHSHSCTIHLAPPVSESLLKGDSFELSDKTGDRNWNFVKEIQTHERFKRMQFIRTKHKVNFQGNPLYQATKQYVVKQQLKGEKWHGELNCLSKTNKWLSSPSHFLFFFV